jgi:hypothetical protein
VLNKFIPVLLLSWLILIQQSFANVTLKVIETDPASPATLGNWEELYLRVQYDTDSPIRIRGEAYSGENKVTGITSGAYLYKPTSGTGMFWFSYTKPMHIDRIVVFAEDARSNQSIAQTEIPVDINWTGQNVSVKRSHAAWVNQALAEQNRKQKESYDAYMSQPTSLWEGSLFFMLIWSVPAYVVLQIFALWRMEGGWQIASTIPLLPMGCVLAYTFYAYSAGSNLFPLILIFTSPLAVIYLVILFIAKKVTD